MSAAEAPRGLLEARGLWLEVAGRPLLEASDFSLRDGSFVLLVGPSGSGKSLLTDVLLGLVGLATPGLRVGGSLTLMGRELLGAPPEARLPEVAAVFQLHALGLFDDLTLEQNLRLGGGDPDRARALAARLGLGAEALRTRAAQASGGERMRTAVARALLGPAGVRVYDEPSTGLDPVSVERVVGAIREYHARLTLVVTHDHAAFLAHADQVLLLDPASRRLVALDPQPGLGARLRGALEARAGPEPARKARPGRLARLAAALDRLGEGTLRALLDLGAVLTFPLGLLRALHPVHGPRWRRCLGRDLAPAVVAFVALGAVLVALTATWFLFERMPQRDVAEPLLQDDIVAGLGLISVRVVVPLLASVLLAAKLGASASASFGQMSLGRQLAALRLLGHGARRHLLWPTAAGQVLAAWVGTAVATALAFGTSLCVFLVQHPGWGARWFGRAYASQVEASDLGWVAAKAAASALAVAAAAWRMGAGPKADSGAVVRGIHRTLLLALLLVLAVHAAFAFLEF